MKIREFLVTALCTASLAAVASAQTGACCITTPHRDPVCVETTEVRCTALEGTYQGDDTTCADTTCPAPPTGACCLTLGRRIVCAELTEDVCDLAGGRYQGDDTTCDTADCTPPTSDCPCDLDMDGDADSMDLLAFLDDWFAGEGDFDGDADTDVHDLMAFIRCFAPGCV